MIYTAISSRLTVGEAAYILVDCGAKLFVTSQALAPLAAELLGAWKAGGYERDGKAGLDLKGLLAANLDPTAAEQAALTPQASENLPEYGFCFRDGWGTPQETYLL